MLRNVNELHGLSIHATDGELGSVDEFYFDDRHWSIRYMVVNAGGWLLRDTVLISPRSIRAIDWDRRRVDVDLTREQVQAAPSTETDRPVSRQMELAHSAYYNYDPYWYGSGLSGGMSYSHAGAGPLPAGMQATEREREVEHDQPSRDTHLRSTREVIGYHIRASDGAIGHISDMLIDEATWAVRYLVVDTHNWLPGKHVLVAPAWVSAVSWADRTVDADLSRDIIKTAPEYDPAQLNRSFEEGLYRHYQRSVYWDEPPTKG